MAHKNYPLQIKEDAYRRIKQRSLDEGITIKQIISDALDTYFLIKDEIYIEFSKRAHDEGMTIKEALAEAINDWLDRKLDEEYEARKKKIGRFRIAEGLKNDPSLKKE
jgi:hypothetical protein